MSRFDFGGRRPLGPQEDYGQQRDGYEDSQPFFNKDTNPLYPEEDRDPRLFSRRSQEVGDYYQDQSPVLRTDSRLSSQGPHYTTRQAQENLRGLSFWQDDDNDNAEDPENWPDRPSPFKFLVAIMGLVVLAGVFWFAYRWVSQPSSDAPGLIQAEPGPFKVKPENPGGASIPHQDKLIYGRITPGTEQPVERLLPPPEQPTFQPQPAAPAPYAAAQAPQAQQPAGQPSYVIVDPKTGVVQQVYQAAPSGAPEAVYHAPVDGTPQNSTVQVAPQQGYYAYPPLPATVTQGNGGQQQPQPISQPVYVQPPVVQQSPTPSIQAIQTVKEDVVLTEEKTQAKAPEKVVPASGNFYIQMATLPNRESATVEATRLGRKADLSDTTPFVRATAGPDVKFRVLAGPFNSKTDALAKCNKLGMGCRVVELPIASPAGPNP